MPAKVDLWFPLYVGDYLADTMHLTTEEHGAYLLLLMAYWKNGKALCDDHKKLASICRMSLDAWSIAQASLKQFFDTESAPGLWVHHRVEEELTKAREQRRRATDRAEKAAKARWGIIKKRGA
jgi:uncharacterized protein YdaU (DUF1376 family)